MELGRRGESVANWIPRLPTLFPLASAKLSLDLQGRHHTHPWHNAELPLNSIDRQPSLAADIT